MQAQKNIGAAGVTMVIIKKELLKKNKRKIPSILSYQNHIDKQSYTIHFQSFRFIRVCSIWIGS